MIRKPDAHEFRESGAVNAIRDMRTVAVEGAQGIRQGTQNFARSALLLLFGFGFLMSVISHLGAVGMLVAFGGGLAWFLSRRRTRSARDQAARWGEPPEVARAEVEPFDPARLELSVGAVGRKAAGIAAPAILFFPTSSRLGFMAPFTIVGIVFLALAMLLVLRLKGDRTAVSYDAQTLTVTGLLGAATMMWADVGDVQVRTASFWNLKTWFTSGSRRNLVVLGRCNRLGGPNTLYIPIDLLGLDQPALAKLITRLLMLRAGADPRHLDRVPAPAPVIVSTPQPTVAMEDAPFDPDAIIARYMAERDQLRAEVRPDLAPGARRASFGRKVV